MFHLFNCVVPDLGNIILPCLVVKDVQPELCAAQLRFAEYDCIRVWVIG